MATRHQNLSETGSQQKFSASGLRFGIVVADWNHEVTDKLEEGAYQTLLKHQASEQDIITRRVPGSIELTLGAQLMAEHLEVDAVICLGCVIQGETRHFDYVCERHPGHHTAEHTIPNAFHLRHSYYREPGAGHGPGRWQAWQ